MKKQLLIVALTFAVVPVSLMGRQWFEHKTDAGVNFHNPHKQTKTSPASMKKWIAKNQKESDKHVVAPNPFTDDIISRRSSNSNPEYERNRIRSIRGFWEEEAIKEDPSYVKKNKTEKQAYWQAKLEAERKELNANHVQSIRSYWEINKLVDSGYYAKSEEEKNAYWQTKVDKINLRTRGRDELRELGPGEPLTREYLESCIRLAKEKLGVN